MNPHKHGVLKGRKGTGGGGNKPLQCRRLLLLKIRNRKLYSNKMPKMSVFRVFAIICPQNGNFWNTFYVWKDSRERLLSTSLPLPGSPWEIKPEMWIGNVSNETKQNRFTTPKQLSLSAGQTGKAAPGSNRSRFTPSSRKSARQLAGVRSNFYGLSMGQLIELADKHADELQQLQKNSWPGEVEIIDLL